MYLNVIIVQLCKERCCEVIELEAMPDHVHWLNRISRLLREEFAHLKSHMPTLWTNSYFVSNIGGAPLKVVKQYIEQQKNA